MPLRLSQIENANDVSVGDFAREDEFLFEASQDFRIAGKFGANQLESNEAFQFRVARFVNRAHSALAEEFWRILETVSEDRAGLELALGGGFA